MRDDSSLARLDEVASLVTEKVTTSKDPNRSYVGLEHLPSGGSQLLGFAEAGQSISTNNVFREGDVLFGKLRPRLRKSIRAPFAGYCSTDILVLRPTASVDPAFAASVLQSDPVFGEAIRTEEGTKMPRCSWSTLRNFLVYCPATPAQQRIAEILSTVDQAIEQTEALIAKTRQIKAGVMHDLFTRGVTTDGQLRPRREEAPQLYKESPLGWIPKEWDTALIGDLLPVNVGYVGPIEKHFVPEGYGVPLLSTANIGDSGFCEEIAHYVSYAFNAQNKKSCVHPGDLLIARHGKSGQVAIVPESIPEAQCLNVVVIRRGQGLSECFMSHLLMHAASRQRLMRHNVGSVQGVVNTKAISGFRVPRPRDDEQESIVSILGAADRRIGEEAASLSQLRHLKSGLMSDLLTGRVPVAVESAPEPKEIAANV